jgi:rhodanese-related sulfurtransferase
MLSAIKKMLGMGQSPDLGALIEGGAVIIDVRTPAEYAAGHLKNSTNIPLNTLGAQLAKLKKDRAIITCCASGMRSASARTMLKSNGFEQVHNGGSWLSLKKYEK